MKLSFHITEKARALLRLHRSGSEYGELIPELIWSQKNVPPYDGKWIVGYHDRKVWDDAPAEWKFFVDGESFLISALHPSHLPFLDGAILDVDPTGKTFRFKLSKES